MSTDENLSILIKINLKQFSIQILFAISYGGTDVHIMSKRYVIYYCFNLFLIQVCT